MAKKNSCETCKFWRQRKGEDADTGVCCMNAPIGYTSASESDLRLNEYTWPMTLQSDWCGRYSPKAADSIPEESQANVVDTSELLAKYQKSIGVGAERVQLDVSHLMQIVEQ